MVCDVSATTSRQNGHDDSSGSRSTGIGIDELSLVEVGHLLHAHGAWPLAKLFDFDVISQRQHGNADFTNSGKSKTIRMDRQKDTTRIPIRVPQAPLLVARHEPLLLNHRDCTVTTLVRIVSLQLPVRSTQSVTHRVPVSEPNL